MNKKEFNNWINNLNLTDSRKLNKRYSKRIEDLEIKNRIMKDQIKEIVQALNLVIKNSKRNKEVKK